MKRFATAAAIAMAGFLLPISSATDAAESSAVSETRLEDLLHTLQQMQKPSASARAPVSVSGTYRFVVDVKFPRGFDYTGVLYCQVSVSHNGSVGQNFSSQRTIPMTLGAKSARCINLLPYAYDEAESTLPIFPQVFVFTKQTTASAPHDVTASKRLASQPLPANGATTIFNIDLEL